MFKVSLMAILKLVFKVRSGDTSLSDEPKTGRLSHLNEYALRELVETNPFYSSSHHNSQTSTT